MVSSFSAVEFAPLHYRCIEKAKINALKVSKGNFDAIMSISYEMKNELLWWINNLSTQKRSIEHGNATIQITTDSSLLG